VGRQIALTYSNENRREFGSRVQKTSNQSLNFFKELINQSPIFLSCIFLLKISPTEKCRTEK